MDRTSWQTIKCGIKLTILLSILLWSGILVVGLHRQYQLLAKAKDQVEKDLVGFGFSSSKMAEKQSGSSLLTGQTALLRHLQEQRNGEDNAATVAAWKQQKAGKSSLVKMKNTKTSSQKISASKAGATGKVLYVFNNKSNDITKYNRAVSPSRQTAVNSTSKAPKRREVQKKELFTAYKGNKTSEQKKVSKLYQNMDLKYLLKNFYIIDSSTSVDKKIFQPKTLLKMSMQIKKKKTPQILIYHTHAASERFANSRANKDEDSIVGVGEELAQILTRKYGYHVIHDETKYDMVKGSIDRNKAYNQSGDGVKRLLQKYPDIQVIIDLHRDGVGNKVHRLTSIKGKRTAQVMFFNGLSRNQKGNIAYLHNDNLQANLAFSLQMKIACMKTYPGFAKPIYLKNYRYNLHMKQRSLLIELGNENNTVEEAKNAMTPLADVLHQVLSGKNK